MTNGCKHTDLVSSLDGQLVFCRECGGRYDADRFADRLLEPTTEMIEAGLAALSERGIDSHFSDQPGEIAAEVWRAMQAARK